MAHKAKTKSKPGTQQSKTNPKAKVSQKNTKANEKKTTTTTTGNIVESPQKCSFTEPIVRVVDPHSAAKESKPPQKPEPEENKSASSHLVIFHKRGGENSNIDFIGAKALTTWKKSSGRSKSWTNCRRIKLSQGALELLVESQTRPFAFGWRFSDTVAPSSFLRSQGLSINSASKRERSSTTRNSGYIAIDIDRKVPLPRGRPIKGYVNRQFDEYHAEFGFLRLTFNREIVSLTQERYLTAIYPLTSYEMSETKKNSKTREIETLCATHLIRNDSHADVYLVQNPNYPFELYHAHAFLNDGFSGNWATFAKRKMKHLRESRSFVFETLQGGKRIIVMQPESKIEEFRLKLTQNDFPYLPGTYPKFAKIHPKKIMGRMSYAAMVERKQPSKRPANSNHRAYRAWEDRNGGGKKKVSTKLKSASGCTTGVRQLDSKVEEDFTDWVTVGRKKLPFAARRNQASNPSKLDFKKRSG